MIGLPRLSRYLPYYQDCVREDRGQGARFFLTDEGNRFLVPPLSKEWGLEEEGVLTIPLDGNVSTFAKSIKLQRGSGALFYGYPLYVDWIEKSKKGWSGGFALPVFLLPVEYELKRSGLEMRLTTDWPRVNNEFLKRVFPSVEERRNFLHEIGLLETEGDPPDGGLANFALRLRELNEIPELEPIHPTAMTMSPRLADLTAGGLYNRCIVVLGERSKFTAGLENELEALKKDSFINKSGSTSLRQFFGDIESDPTTHTSESTKTYDLVEIVPLNEEQRAAVRSSFENTLTVVTGPPGTGKSQVVVSVLANACLRGDRVLFTSRNNKAVNVVEARINSFSNLPLVVRVGTKSGERDFRSELLRFLTQCLSVSTTEEDHHAYVNSLETLNSLRKRRDALWRKAESVREARNLIDRIDRELDGPRERLGQALFKRLFSSAEGLPFGDPEMALNIVKWHIDSSSSFIRRLSRWFRRRKDAATVLQQIYEFQNYPNLFGELPSVITGKEDWEQWIAPLENLLERVRVIEKIGEYRVALAELKELPALESFADELSDLEQKTWYWGGRLISSYARLLPERLTPGARRSLGEFRATIERLAQNQVGGQVYAQIRREQERLFPAISKVLPTWCVTNLAARGTLPLEPGFFDLVIIDEASQCDIPSAIPLFFRAKRAMIIGDPQQLRHISHLEKHLAQIIESRHGLIKAEDQPYTYVNNSLFDLAVTCAGEAKVITLRDHFRSHEDIIAFSNRTWYRGTLRVCTDYRYLEKYSKGGPAVRWSQVASTVYKPGAGGAISADEAKAVVDELEDLLVRRRFSGNVGIVTPFRAQANRIRDMVYERLDYSLIEKSDLIVDTAHGFQGDERDVILFSPCIAPELPRGAKYFLSSTGNLFNVAITRARALLHVIGNGPACANCGVPFIEEFANYVARLGKDEKRDEEEFTYWSDPRIGHWEKFFFEALIKAGLKPMAQYPVHQYRLDFAIVQDDIRLDIEIDGEYFHRDWDGSRCREDIIRDWRLTMLGWRVKRFWVYRIRDEMDQCVREVIETLGQLRTDRQ